MQETIHWVPVSERLPDDDETVLIALNNGSEPVWLGWRIDGQWYDTEGSCADVTHWAPMPASPQQAQEAAR